MSEDNTRTEENAASQAHQTPDENAELTIQDLVAIKSIIDVASQRGAFKPNEMVAVGSVYSKLEKFLTVAQSQAQKAQGQTPNA